MTRSIRRWLLSLAGVALLAAPAEARCTEPKAGAPLKLLIVTGGHDYEPLEFFRAFDTLKGITYQHVFTRDTAKPQSFPMGGLGQYDVVLFYDMEHGDITPEWRDLIARGKGIVFLHHAIGSFPGSTELRAFAGGQADFKAERPAGVPLSTYEHNVLEHFTITDHAHPVTCGVHDFAMIDEGYDHYFVDPGAHVVMTSDFPTDNRAAAWSWSYEGKRVFLLQPGHGSLGMPADHGASAFQNRDFMRMLNRAIFWAAGRL